ncbi:MAG: hypothetical protein K2X98_05360 [Alphaproteobacteria bacterium]|nr:hypothetical protein [Alphaproteobacteria bacterium]
MSFLFRYPLVYIIIFVCWGNLEKSHALTKDAAVERCQINIKLLEGAPGSFLDKEVESIFKKMIKHLDEILTILKKTNDVKEIYVARQSCENGFKAAQWMVENFALAKTDEVLPEKNVVSKKESISGKQIASEKKASTEKPKNKDTHEQTSSNKQQPNTKQPAKAH